MNSPNDIRAAAPGTRLRRTEVLTVRTRDGGADEAVRVDATSAAGPGDWVAIGGAGTRDDGSGAARVDEGE